MNSCVAVLFSLVICGIFIGEVHSLKCYQCRAGSCPSTASGDVTEMDCSAAQDTCYKFDGLVRQGGTPFPGRTTRTCAAYSVLQQFTPGNIAKNTCVNVTEAKDPYKDEYYTGRFCLCNNKDFCNGASGFSPSSLILAFFAAMAKFF